MLESIDFRLFEKDASTFLLPNVGKRLGELTRQVIVQTDSAMFELIRQADLAAKSSGRGGVFGGWIARRKYTTKEIAQAELFQLQITAFFEPDGEGCGTVYDYTAACQYCGVGRKLVGELVLDLSKVPKGKDFAQSISGDEWIVSERLAKLIREKNIAGVELHPVRHARSSRVQLPTWYQLRVVSKPLHSAPPTRFGIDPFDEDVDGKYRCPVGHISGLNILSELTVKVNGWNKSDIAVTQDMVGTREGVLVPHPLILISPNFYRLLSENNIKGYKAEVAYFE